MQLCDLQRFGAAAPLLEGIFNKMSEIDDCCDNYRIARIDVPEELEQYANDIRAGCCGSLDEVHTVFQQIYLMGLNYGH